MTSISINNPLNQILTFKWKPTSDLAVVALSWVLVVGALYTATNIIGQNIWGGMGYFLMYALVGATLFGVGIPLYWMGVVRKRPLADLGLTTQRWAISLGLQLVLSLIVNVPRLMKAEIPPLQQLIPLLLLALTIGFFEAVFWRGWVQLRLEESFGAIPAILIASLLYAAYHIGYGMLTSEMVFLFFIGIMFAVVFRLTRSVLILWPFFQPTGQLITLISDKLSLPLIAALGFAEVFAIMLVFIWLVSRYHKRTLIHPSSQAKAL
jgi:hypothetical protein